MATVRTPAEGFTGTVVGVTFVDGVADTDDDVALAYFRRRGYDVEESQDFDLSKANKGDLIAYATEHGIDVDPKANKGDILESIRAAEQGPGSDDTTGGTEPTAGEGDPTKTDDDPTSPAPTE